MNIFPTRTYWPTHTWRTASPSDLGAEAAYLTRLDQYARGIADMRSILIARSGYILFEEYYHDAGPHTYQNINSITKSSTSALVGIAVREGYLSSLDQCVLPFFPTYLPDDAHKQDITLRHLLTMSSGYQEPPDDILTFLEDTTSTEKMLARPIRHTPGNVYSYDDVNLHCLSLILTSLTQMPLAAYAQSRLKACSMKNMLPGGLNKRPRREQISRRRSLFSQLSGIGMESPFVMIRITTSSMSNRIKDGTARIERLNTLISRPTSWN